MQGKSPTMGLTLAETDARLMLLPSLDFIWYCSTEKIEAYKCDLYGGRVGVDAKRLHSTNLAGKYGCV